MRTSTASLLLLLCLVGSTFALTYEESKLIADRRHRATNKINLEEAPATEEDSTIKMLQQLYNIFNPLIQAALNGDSQTLLGDAEDANQQILQQIVDGFYEENSLADPTVLVGCVDPTDAALIVSFLPTFFSKASSLLTISAAITAAQNLATQLNPDVLTCIQSDPELVELGTVYDITSINPQTAVSWLSSHVSSFTGEFAALNKLWNQKNYSGIGNNAATFAHTVLNAISTVKSSEMGLSNQEITQQYYNGFYAQQGLPNPTYVAECYPQGAYDDFVAFEPTFLKKAGSISTIADAFQNLEDFDKEQASKYPEMIECQKGNQEIANLSVALGIKHPETVNDTVKAYINANLFSTTSEFNTAYKSWTSGNYATSGKQVSAWTKKSLAKN